MESTEPEAPAAGTRGSVTLSGRSLASLSFAAVILAAVIAAGSAWATTSIQLDHADRSSRREARRAAYAAALVATNEFYVAFMTAMDGPNPSSQVNFGHITQDEYSKISSARSDFFRSEAPLQLVASKNALQVLTILTGALSNIDSFARRQEDPRAWRRSFAAIANDFHAVITPAEDESQNLVLALRADVG